MAAPSRREGNGGRRGLDRRRFGKWRTRELPFEVSDARRDAAARKRPVSGENDVLADLTKNSPRTTTDTRTASPSRDHLLAARAAKKSPPHPPPSSAQPSQTLGVLGVDGAFTSCRSRSRPKPLPPPQVSAPVPSLPGSRQTDAHPLPGDLGARAPKHIIQTHRTARAGSEATPFINSESAEREPGRG